MVEVAADDVLRWDLGDLDRLLAEAPTAVVCVTHGSNVTGAVQALGRWSPGRTPPARGSWSTPPRPPGRSPSPWTPWAPTRSPSRGTRAARPDRDRRAGAGAGVAVPPLIVGGTGTVSEREDPPLDLPVALEAGTANALACAGLAVAVRWIEEQGVAALHARAAAVGQRLRQALAALPGVRLHAADGPDDLPIALVQVAGWDPHELATALDAGVATRAGLHCAPRAHRRLGTAPEGRSGSASAPCWSRTRSIGRSPSSRRCRLDPGRFVCRPALRGLSSDTARLR